MEDFFNQQALGGFDPQEPFMPAIVVAEQLELDKKAAEIAELSKKGYQLLKENKIQEANEAFYEILKLEDNNNVITNIKVEYSKHGWEDDEFKMFVYYEDGKINELNGDDCLNEYFRQKGFVFSWHTVWNKVYSMKLWKKARKHYDKITKRLIMTEDFAFSTVLFYYAKKKR